MVACGIDCGSEAVKIVLLKDGGFSWTSLQYGERTTKETAEKGFQYLLEREKIVCSDVRYIISTGVGRKSVEFSKESVSEILCLAKGANFICPNLKCAVDVGARNINVVKCSGGKVLKFLTNSRCASGTGMFLKMASGILGLKMEELDQLSLQSRDSCELQSTCAVFAESEIISLIHEGKKIEDIVKGIMLAIANRIYGFLFEIGAEEPVFLSGGLGRIKSVKILLEGKLGKKVIVPENPLIVNALGAALIAKERSQ